MRTVQAKTVGPGQAFLHPDTRIPLRVVQPRNFHASVDNNAVLAVDDEGGLYSVPAEEQVEVPWSVPLVTRPCEDAYIVTASFERRLSDDLPVLRDSFKAGNITADPDYDFALAAQQQIALEIRVAFEGGELTGFFQCHRTIPGRAYDTAAMGWRSRDQR